MSALSSAESCYCQLQPQTNPAPRFAPCRTGADDADLINRNQPSLPRRLVPAKQYEDGSLGEDRGPLAFIRHPFKIPGVDQQAAGRFTEVVERCQ